MSSSASFDQLQLKSSILEALKKLGFEKPTLIQEKSIIPALEGKNIIGQSQTGSGKTLAFGLPIIQNVYPKKGLQALIITPTRELCIQVTKALTKVCIYSKLKPQAIYGGVQYNLQIKALKKDEIIVATPGRLLDHIDKKIANFSNIKFLVLDEADKMLEMGFLEDVELIISKLPKRRQTMLYSATIPSELKGIIKKHIKNPIYLRTQDYVSNQFLSQSYYEISKTSKFSLLVHLLRQDSKQKAIIFTATRNETDLLYHNLKFLNIKCFPLHGGYSQAKRLETIKEFHSKRTKVLIATDIAARGLDIKGITHIYNWDIPHVPIDYVHRIGRTARAGETGYAISLITPRDKNDFEEIYKLHRKELKKLVVKGLKKVEINRNLKIADLSKKDSKLTKKSFSESRKDKKKSFKSSNRRTTVKRGKIKKKR